MREACAILGILGGVVLLMWFVLTIYDAFQPHAM